MKLKNAKFAVKDVTQEKIPLSDIIFCIAVIEYYQDFEPILKKMLKSTKKTFVLTDARFIFWRAVLRKILSKLKNFPIYYHNPQEIKMVAKRLGFKCDKEIELHSFRTFIFKRQ